MSFTPVPPLRYPQAPPLLCLFTLQHGFFDSLSAAGMCPRRFILSKMASQSFASADAKSILSVFCRDMCVAENTYQAASVEFVRRWRANYARSRLRSLCRKNPSVFPTVSSAAGMCPRRFGSIHIFILVAARRQEVRQPYQHILCLHAVVLLIRMQPQRDVEVPAQ